ncbi:MAG: hypothetical protein LBT12_02150 [Oscillospiraceae bacterium]|nr:hypothetical protein [Oscillospiraceae bacterium]
MKKRVISAALVLLLCVSLASPTLADFASAPTASAVLVNGETLTKLERLQLENTPLTSRQLDDLRRALPDCEIIF